MRWGGSEGLPARLASWLHSTGIISDYAGGWAYALLASPCADF